MKKFIFGFIAGIFHCTSAKEEAVAAGNDVVVSRETYCKKIQMAGKEAAISEKVSAGIAAETARQSASLVL
jgi:hypothetical protein